MCYLSLVDKVKSRIIGQVIIFGELDKFFKEDIEVNILSVNSEEELEVCLLFLI